MAVGVCPSCHERFRYDSRAKLEVVPGNVAVVPDGGRLTFRSDQRVIHACVNPSSDRAVERDAQQGRHRADQVT